MVIDVRTDISPARVRAAIAGLPPAVSEIVIDANPADIKRWLEEGLCVAGENAEKLSKIPNIATMAGRRMIPCDIEPGAIVVRFATQPQTRRELVTA